MNEERQRIILTLPHADCFAGSEVQTLHLAGALAGSGRRVALAVPGRLAGDVRAAFESAGAEVLVPGRGSGGASGVGRSPGPWVSLFRRERPSIVHVQYLAPGLVPILAARIAGVPRVLATVHRPACSTGLRGRFLLRMAARLTSLFLCVSRRCEESWFGDSAVWGSDDCTGRRHATLPNGIPCEDIAARCQCLRGRGGPAGLSSGRPRTIVCVAALRCEKGHGDLLDAMCTVVGDVPDAALVLVGDGPEGAAVRDRIARLGLAGNVRLAGQVSPARVWDFLAEADLAVVPSLYEGFGLAAAEAMAAALPVVGYAGCGLEEVVATGVTGLLVSPRNATGLGAAISALLTDPGRARAYGEAGRRKVLREFGMETYRRRVLDVHERLLH